MHTLSDRFDFTDWNTAGCGFLKSTHRIQTDRKRSAAVYTESQPRESPRVKYEIDRITTFFHQF